MYTHKNFKTKKALKDAVAEYLLYQGLADNPDKMKHAVTVFQPGPFGGNEKQNGSIALEGPHYPEPHRWYATAELKGGVVVKVK
jgi:hypothetical protein